MRARLAFLSNVMLLPAVVFFAGGCTYDDGHMHGSCVDQGTCPGDNTPDPIAESTIDTGATLADIEAGGGAGAFVEYEAGGKWHVFTTCDTKLSGYSCTWDIIVAVSSANEMSNYEAEDLESDDYLDWYGKRAVRFVGDVTDDFDGFLVDATPGATLSVDVYLDGDPAPRYIYWVGAGGLHQGSPTNPIKLTPTDP
jgi:hypothetical protein